MQGDTNIIARAKEYVNELLIPLENHYYHQYSHALEVMQRCIYLGKKEGLNEEDIEILALSSLFHDTGFIIQYEDNEFIGAKIAKNFLKSMLYPENKIKQIEKLILATRLAHTPTNIYEEIIKDSDLDNVGTKEFFQKNEKIRKELEIIKNIKICDQDWKHGAIDFLDKHKYYTKTQQKERGAKKEYNKKILQKLSTTHLKKPTKK